ncbi:MAG TPA: hypothetical protein VJU82_01380 [Acidobacteriaceae bacterium]|nr:hypothetical protein [Acidobacteriaceae bacterium]
MLSLPVRALRATPCLSSIAFLIAFAAQAAAHAQTQADRALIAKARSRYLLGPIPGSISCDVQLNWDRFFATMKIEQTDAVKARLATLKKMQIAVVSKDAAHTDVTISSTDSGTAQVSEGLLQQLKGFFQIYWSAAYGNSLPREKEDFHLTSGTDGYTVEAKAGASTSSIHMDSSLVVDHMTLDEGQMNADIRPTFNPGDDNLLRLRSEHQAINMGTSRMEIDVDLDYQTVGKFDVPQHVTLAIPGAYAFDYLLTNCKVDSAAPAKSPAAEAIKN